ncbi:MAG: phosphoadenylyl-sulfate reductase [Hellea sp.]|nr:phosphoadenylyl-sulfate reductase [Hellea sp.]
MAQVDVLIRDGHAGGTAAIDDVAPLEEFLSSNQLLEKVKLPNDTDLSLLIDYLPRLKTIMIDFPSFADGRGFSIARELRKKYGFTGDLIADGPLIPDQYVYALQCGFDAVKVDGVTYERQAESHWYDALDAFKVTYQRAYEFKNGPEISVFDARETSASSRNNNDPYYGLSASEALRRAIKEYDGNLVLASSMGVDSSVLLHMVAEIDKNLPIIFLDTGKHFRETLHYRDKLVSMLGLTNLINIAPDRQEIKTEDPHSDLNQTNADACCDLRKVRPLSRKIFDYKVRITGRKRFQTPDRRNLPILQTNDEQVKLNPLAYWSAKDVTAYMRKHKLPTHPLLSLGFLSVGCQPCTTRVSDGEDARAGRWRNLDKDECGIHYVDGKWAPIKEKKTLEVF